MAETPGTREDNQRAGGRPPLYEDFVAVCDAVLGAWSGSGETVTEIAERFGVSRGWIWKWVYPALGYERPRPCGTNAGESSARGRRSDKAF